LILFNSIKAVRKYLEKITLIILKEIDMVCWRKK